MHQPRSVCEVEEAVQQLRDELKLGSLKELRQGEEVRECEVSWGACSRPERCRRLRKVCQLQQRLTLQDGEAGQGRGRVMRVCVALTEISATPINQKFEIFFFQIRDQPPAALAPHCITHCTDGPRYITVPSASSPAPAHDEPAPLPPKHTQYRDLVPEDPTNNTPPHKQPHCITH